MRTRLLVVVALVAALTTAVMGSLFGGAGAAGTTTLVVTRNNMQHWQQTTSGGGGGSFRTGPAVPPLGGGSFQLTTGLGTASTGGKATLANPDYALTPIATISALQYSTYRTAAQTPAVDTYISIPVYWMGNKTQPTTLVFEPVYSNNTGTLPFGSWSAYDALAGKWWSTNTVPGFTGGQAVADMKTWSQVVAAGPGTIITETGSIAFTAGQSSPGAPWQSFIGSLDRAVIGVSGNTTTFDFDGSTTISRENSPAGWVKRATGTATGQWDNGPGTPPLGTGSIRLRTGTDGDSVLSFRNGVFDGAKLSDIAGMSYDTYTRTLNTTPPHEANCVAPYVGLSVSGVPAVNGKLSFEPCYQSGGFSTTYHTPDQGPTATGVWQHWDAKAGLWWLGGDPLGFRLMTLDQWQATYPAATVTSNNLSFQIQAGGGGEVWQAFDGSVDDFNVARAGVGDGTYDFEDALPTLDSFLPASGPAGTAVTISGSNLGNVSAVKFNGTPASFTIAGPNQINTTVPAGATTGAITLTTPQGPISSANNFVVPVAGLSRFEETETIFDFSQSTGWTSWSHPTLASGGTAELQPNIGGFVDIHFDGPEAQFIGLKGPNTAIAEFILDGLSQGSVDTYNPTYLAQQVLYSTTGLTTGSHTLRVRYSGKNAAAQNPTYLVVDAIDARVPAPTVTGFAPVSGPPGTNVTITGTTLATTNGVRFNGTIASFTVQGPTQVLATVPNGATSGPISVTTRGGTVSTATSFTVDPVPVISYDRFEEDNASVFHYSTSGWFRWQSADQSGGFTELNGNDGSYVDVTFGGPAVKWIGVRGPNTSKATITIDAVGYGTLDTYNPTYQMQAVLFQTTALSSGNHTMRIQYTGKNPSAASTTYLTIDALDIAKPAPIIKSFTPAGAPVGTSVTLTGSKFTGATSVKFNGTAAPYTVNSDSSIATSVPLGATSGPITVTGAGGTSGSTLSIFTVGPDVLNRYEETNAAFDFASSPGWINWTDSELASGGTGKLNPNNGSFADIHFTGSTIHFISIKGPNTSVVKFFIDGVNYGSVDTYNSTYVPQQVLLSVSGLAPGNHTLRVQYNGKNAAAASTTYLVVDAIEAAGV